MSIHLRRLFALIAALPILLSISLTALAGAATDRAALEAAAQAWVKAFNSRDAVALISCSTVDVVLLDANLAPASGEAARAALRQAMGAAKGQLATVTKEAEIAGDVAWRIGALAHQLPSGEVLNRGQSLEIWRRVNGTWKLHRQMSSHLLSQPKLLPRPLPPEPVLDTPTH